MKKISSYKKNFSLFLLFSLLALSVLAYWFYSQRYVATDDAYINANSVQVASRVTGQVIKLDVQNNEAVRKGQILFRLDPATFITKINQANAQLEKDKVILSYQIVTAKRIFLLSKQGGVLPQQTHDDALKTLEVAKEQVNLDQARLQAAELNLQYTKVTAATDGWISNMTLRPQNMVTANEPQFALISNKVFWVDANFKETDIDKIKIGQMATIYVDMYPNHVFHGVVESMSRGSANAFALLPPQNATSNWIKVIQRVPIRIRILNTDPNYPLYIGTSANVTIPITK